MPQIISNRFRTVAGAALALALAAVLLAACGSSSSTTSSSSSAPASASAGTGTTPGARSGFAARGAALRGCLAKQGITLPARKPGQTPGTGTGTGAGAGGVFGPGAGGGFKLPAGVSRAKFQAAIAKCGGLSFAGRRAPRLNSPAYRASLVKFAACMRENGENVPAPNTSGTGAVFSDKGLNVKSPKFLAASRKCFPLVRQGFAGPAGGAAPAPGPGSAGTGGAAPAG
jgi:hypothetical protein